MGAAMRGSTTIVYIISHMRVTTIGYIISHIHVMGAAIADPPPSGYIISHMHVMGASVADPPPSGHIISHTHVMGAAIANSPPSGTSSVAFMYWVAPSRIHHHRVHRQSHS